MKKIAITLFVILLVSICFSTTVHLRKGGTIEGEVISKDDEKLVIKTAEGEKTLKWRQLTNKSIKEIHPELYEELKAKALERKKEKEKLEKPIKEKEIPNQPIFLSVKSRKTRGRFEKMDKKKMFEDSKARKKRDWNMVKFYKKEQQVEIKIKINGLDSKKEYVLKTVYSHHLKDFGNGGMFFSKTDSPKNVEKINRLKGEKNYEIKISTSLYYQYKEKITDSDYHFRKGEGRQKEYGAKSKGLDISVWLDDKLIYEKKAGKIETYYENVKKL